MLASIQIDQEIGDDLPGIFQKWMEKLSIWFDHKTEDRVPDPTIECQDPIYEFSPMTYHNPCISKIYEILKCVLAAKQISYKKLELVIVDADEGRDGEDDRDIREVLSQLTPKLNYLLLVTDRPDHYDGFIYTMYEENGLIVQQIPKSARKSVRGNLILDFERCTEVSAESMIRPGAVYLPVYKKPWEIGENLDIIVPVGYNTLVVEGILSSGIGVCGTMDESFIIEDKIDRLDQEFRKG